MLGNKSMSVSMCVTSFCLTREVKKTSAQEKIFWQKYRTMMLGLKGMMISVVPLLWFTVDETLNHDALFLGIFWNWQYCSIQSQWNDSWDHQMIDNSFGIFAFFAGECLCSSTLTDAFKMCFKTFQRFLKTETYLFCSFLSPPSLLSQRSFNRNLHYIDAGYHNGLLLTFRGRITWALGLGIHHTLWHDESLWACTNW